MHTMSFQTATLIMFAVTFGFSAGVYWATRRREEWLREHQPDAAGWGDAAYFDRMTARLRQGGAL